MSRAFCTASSFFTVGLTSLGGDTKDDDDLDKTVKKLSAKDEEEAEFDYMNDVEARQRKLVEKHQKATK
jgi:hypothetical protein